MKFVLCHVCSLVAAFGCLAVLSNSAVMADEKEKKEVVVESEVVVVAAGEEDENVAEAIKKALREKLDGLPEDVRKKIEAKVYAVEAVPSKQVADQVKKRIQLKLDEVGDVVSKAGGEIKIQAKAIIVGEDGKTKVIELDGKDLTAALPKVLAETKQLKSYRVQAETTKDGQPHVHVIRIDGDDVPKKGVMLFEGKPHSHEPHVHVHKVDGDKKEMRVVVVKTDDEQSAKSDDKKTITVEIKDGQVILNGKPIKGNISKAIPESAKKRIQLRVETDGDKDPKQQVRRRMMFFSKDGEAKEIDIDVLKKEQNVWIEKAHDAVKKQHAEVAKQHADMAKKHQAVVKEMAAKHAAMAKKIHAEALKKQHAAHTHTHDAPAMGKQLKEIKAELVKIRKLLEEIQEDEEDEDEEDDD